jgi:hypothetical protein
MLALNRNVLLTENLLISSQKIGAETPIQKKPSVTHRLSVGVEDVSFLVLLLYNNDN